ncbi:MAG: nitroreductase family protein [Methyloligellaceae bacterium]
MSNNFQAVSQAIRDRKTKKVISDGKSANNGTLDIRLVDELIEIAGWAPFHHPVHPQHRADNKKIIEPWRVYKLDGAMCNNIINHIDSDDNPGKIPGMLSAADAVLNVTWLPDPDPAFTAPEFAPTERNMEHIAAASAFIQNLLIAATAKGITTYWSSGGVFNKPRYKKLMQIPEQEILLGSVFLFPDDVTQYEVKDGKLREARSSHTSWSRWITTTSA